jgi:hypothetical protein
MLTDQKLIKSIVDRVTKQVKLSHDLEMMREHPRYPVDVALTLGRLTEDSGELQSQGPGWARDISSSGMLILSGLPQDRGELIDIDLTRFTVHPSFARAKVMHCKELLPSAFEVGVAFVIDG